MDFNSLAAGHPTFDDATLFSAASPSLTYAQAFRVIGQALVPVQPSSFNIARHHDDYLTSYVAKPKEKTRPGLLKCLSIFKKDELRIGDLCDRDDQKELLHTPEEIWVLDEIGRAQRRDPKGVPDPFSLANILRAVGWYLDNQRHCRFIFTTYHDARFDIVYETAQGLRRMEEYPIAVLYDLWVKQYLKKKPQAGRAATISIRPSTTVQQRELVSAPEEVAQAKTSILIVDKDQRFVGAMESVIASDPDLRLAGTVEQGALADQLIARINPRVVIFNVDAPNREEFELMRLLKVRWPEIKVIVTSSNPDPQNAILAFDYWADGFLEKKRLAAGLARMIKLINERSSEAAQSAVYAPSELTGL